MKIYVYPARSAPGHRWMGPPPLANRECCAGGGTTWKFDQDGDMREAYCDCVHGDLRRWLEHDKTQASWIAAQRAAGHEVIVIESLEEAYRIAEGPWVKK